MESPFTEMGKSMREANLRGKIRAQFGHVNFVIPITYASGVRERIVGFMDLVFGGAV